MGCGHPLRTLLDLGVPAFVKASGTIDDMSWVSTANVVREHGSDADLLEEEFGRRLLHPVLHCLATLALPDSAAPMHC